MPEDPLEIYKQPLEAYKFKLEQLKSSAPKEFKKVCCPSCDHPVSAEEINIHDKVAKCMNCNVIFPLHEDIAVFSNPKKIKQEVFRPEGIELFQFQGDLDFSIQQPRSEGVIATVIFLPFIAALFTLAVFTKGISLLWPLIPLLLTIIPVVNLVNRFKHKIYININDKFLSVRWRPKKFHKDQIYAIDEIDQLYIKSIASPNYYALYMIINGLEGQKHIKLIPRLESRSKARYLEQEIERYLGILDREVPEER